MRVAIVTPGYSASDEDWCIPALQDLACRLGKRQQVHVFATTYPHRRSDYRVKGIAVSSFGDGRSGRLALARRMWKTAAAIEAAHRHHPLDVVHGFWADGGGIVTTWVARRLSIPNVVTVMAGEWTYEPLTGYGKRRRPVAGRMARFAARHADELMVLSSYHADRIRKEQSALQPRVIPFGTDVTRFTPQGPARDLEGELAILCVGSLVPVKCHAHVLEAFALASSRVAGLHLHLVGEGTREPALRTQVDQLGISPSVTFHGHVEHHLLPDYYRGAGFCILGSSFESHGMVILEAAACGRVTIGTAVGSLPEFCPASLLSRPGDVPGLAANMQQLAADAELKDRLAQQAADKLRDEYSLEQSVPALEALYRRVAGRKN